MTHEIDLFQNLSEAPRDVTSDIGGLTYCPEFLGSQEQEALLQDVDSMPWRADLKRRVQHYGYRYDYKARRVDPSMYLGPLPGFGTLIANKLIDSTLLKNKPDQLIVNEYLPGQGISAHVDCEPCFGETIAMVSLGWAYEMEFTHCESRKSQSLILDKGSALVLSGEARHLWLHEIKARKSDRGIPRKRRVSLTFRTVLVSK